MKTQLESSTRLLGGPVIRKCLFVSLAMFVLSNCNLFASDEFQELVRLVPRSANAIVLLNVEKAKDSPMGLREDWKAIGDDMRTALAIYKNDQEYKANG